MPARVGRDRALLALPAVVGTVALLLVARRGAYASPDSAYYVGAARNLLDGHGLSSPPGSPPTGHFPPLFPLVLAGAGALGPDPLDACRWVNPLLYGATALLVAAVVHRRTGSVPVAMAGSAATVVGLDMLLYGASALSEPLFALLALASLVALAADLERPSTCRLVVAAGLAAAATLTRYVGVALIAAGALALVRAGGRGRPALLRAAAYAALAAAPVAGWLAWAGRATRPVVFHPFGGDYWAGGARSLSRWVLPPGVPAPARLVATALVAAALGALAVRLHRRAAGGHPLGALLALFSAAYLAVLAVDRLVLDDTGRLDPRFLLPLHVVAVVGVVPFVHRAAAGRGRRAAAALAVGLLGLQGAHAVAWVAGGVSDDSIRRRGVVARAWRDSRVLGEVSALGPAVPVYTNAADVVFMLTGRATEPLPARVEYLTGRANRDYEAELAAMRGALEGGDGVIVYFHAIRARLRFLPPEGELQRSLGLAAVRRDAVGTMYRLGPRP